jgi:hypothetical protein
MPPDRTESIGSLELRGSAQAVLLDRNGRLPLQCVTSQNCRKNLLGLY